MTDKTILAMLAAEIAYKCCEKGDNWEATRAKVAKLISPGPVDIDLAAVETRVMTKVSDAHSQGKLREILDELRGEGGLSEDDYQTAIGELRIAQSAVEMPLYLSQVPISQRANLGKLVSMLVQYKSGGQLSEDKARELSLLSDLIFALHVMKLAGQMRPLAWRPIEELHAWQPCADCAHPMDCGSMAYCEKGCVQQLLRYGDEQGFLLLAPELVDGDCNVHGVGMGYWQDDRDTPYDEHGRVDGPEPDDSYRLRIIERMEDQHPRYNDALTLAGAMLDQVGVLFGVERDEYGGWLACRWSMSNDEWYETKCTPTHYVRLTGAQS